MRKAMLYVMQAPNGDVKVGFSKNPDQRRRSLGADIVLVHTTDVLDDARRVERLAHRLLVLSGKQIRGEWFEASLEAAIDAVESAIQQADGGELLLGGEFDRMAGRPKPAELVSVNLRLTREMLEWLDDQHAQRLDRPNRSTVAREVFAKVMGDG